MSKNTLIKATVTAILALSVTAETLAADQPNKATKTTHKMAKGLEKCYGIAKAGMNDCSYTNNSCAGSSKEDKEKGAWIFVPKGTCNKIAGSSTKP